MNYITKQDLEALAFGATVLGSGGGGDPAHELVRAQEVLEKSGPVRLLDVSEIKPNDFIMPFAFMGAPLICIEKLASGKEGHILKALIENEFQKKVTCISCCEIGGSNALVPLTLASELGLPLIDGDTLGRAFPELQMSSCTLLGILPSPAFLCDPQGNSVVIRAETAEKTEKIARSCTQELGSNVAVSLYIMNGEQAKKALVRNSYTRAINIGRALLEQKPLVEQGFEFIGRGTIIEFIQEITDGFLKGSIYIKNDTDEFIVDVQNEFLVVFRNDIPVITTPDIICIFDSDGNIPLSSEKIKYGMNVCIYRKQAPAIWKTHEGLTLTGPARFGYDFELIGEIQR